MPSSAAALVLVDVLVYLPSLCLFSCFFLVSAARTVAQRTPVRVLTLCSAARVTSDSESAARVGRCEYVHSTCSLMSVQLCLYKKNRTYAICGRVELLLLAQLYVLCTVQTARYVETLLSRPPGRRQKTQRHRQLPTTNNSKQDPQFVT
jgi:hypothetical protein